jgi:hypothetical protein
LQQFLISNSKFESFVFDDTIRELFHRLVSISSFSSSSGRPRGSFNHGRKDARIKLKPSIRLEISVKNVLDDDIENTQQKELINIRRNEVQFFFLHFEITFGLFFQLKISRRRRYRNKILFYI